MGQPPKDANAPPQDPDRTQVDPDSPARRAVPTATGEERTVVDPDSPARREAAQAVDNDATMIDPHLRGPVEVEGARTTFDVGDASGSRTILDPGRHDAGSPEGAGTVFDLRDVGNMPADRTVLDQGRAAAPGEAERTVLNATPAPPASHGTAAKPQAASLPLPTGFRLHEYRVDGVLGQGGFGIAYAATDVNLNAKVVVKEYLPEDFAYRASDSTVCPRGAGALKYYQAGLDSFLVEARTLATFRHRHIVRVARFFEAHGTAYMVLEYERGESLKSWSGKHPNVPERELVALFAPLLDGLAVVHRAGFLHRDIKPDNIYVRDEDGSLVLLDFGAARQTAAQQVEAGIVVTPGYGPIEQYGGGGGQQGPWTDIYAFGATLFWLLAGKKPPDAMTRFTAHGAGGEGDPLPSIESLCKGRYSDEFLRAIDWALKLHPNDRPQDIAAFRAALFASHAGALGLQAALQAGEEEGGLGAVKGEGLLAALRSPRALRGQLVRFWGTLVRPGSWPIAVKLTLAMVSTALLPMMITADYNLRGTIASVEKSELRNLEQLSQSVAGRVSQLLADNHNLANYLGTDEDFVAYLRSPTPAGTEAIRQKLVGLIDSNPDVQLAMVMDPAGTAVVSSDPQVMGKNFKFREYFKSAMAGKAHVTGIIVGAVAGAAGVFYSYPVQVRDGPVMGVVVLRIKAEPIGRILAEARQGDVRVPFLVDGDGVIIWHPDEKILYKSLVPLRKEVLAEIVADQRFRRKTIESVGMDEFARVAIGAKAPGNLAFHSPIDKRQVIAGYAPVKGHDWVVAVAEASEYFAAPITQLYETVLYSVFLVGAVFLLLAMLFARTIVRPIEALKDAAHALKSGDYDRAHLSVKTNDEVGQLARTFNVMIDVLRQRERERGGGRADGSGPGRGPMAATESPGKHSGGGAGEGACEPAIKDVHDPDWEPPIPRQAGASSASWDDYMALARQVVGRFHGEFSSPLRLRPPGPAAAAARRAPAQARLPGQRGLRRVGRPGRSPMVICCGGVANVAMRFNYLASDLARLPPGVHGLGRPRPLGLDGDEGDYSLATYAEQLRQLIDHLGGGPVTVLGSSLGGSAAIEVAARYPRLVDAADPERRRAAHPRVAAQAPRGNAGAALRVPWPVRHAAQGRRLAEERWPGQRRHPLQPDLPPDALVRRGRRAHLPPRRARAAGLPAGTRPKSLRAVGACGSGCAARCC